MRLPYALAAGLVAALDLGCLWPRAGFAQHASDNALTSAEDAFGLTKGTEAVGLYSDGWIRGFDPQQAGNARIEGLYFDQKTHLGKHVLDGSVIRVGPSAQGYLFPAPTGIVDYELRDPGKSPGATVILSAGPFATRSLDLDVRLPVPALDLALPIGVGYRDIAYLPGSTSNDVELGAAPRWTPNERLTVRLIADARWVRHDRAPPLIYPDGPYAPPPIPARAYSQDWAAGSTLGTNFGLTAHAALDDGWKLSFGAFRSVFVDHSGSYAEFYLNAKPDRAADHTVIAAPLGRVASSSGEVRLARLIHDGARTHELALSVRARDAYEYYDGTDSVDLGPATLGQWQPVPKPDFHYGPHSKDVTRLAMAGLAYHGSWPERGDLTLGLERVNYHKVVTDPGVAPVALDDRPWRLHAAATVRAGENAVLYASYTQGLEDSGTAPSEATNRGAILPAARTWQRDAGVRATLGGHLTAIAGVFDVRKPYFNLTPEGLYAPVGDQRRRGIELSLVGEPRPGLNLVAGAMLGNPGVESASASVGREAVGQPRRVLQLSAEYQLPQVPSVALTGSASNYGTRAATLDNRYELPGRTMWDLGARLKLPAGRYPATLHLQVINAADSFAWDLTDDGGYLPVPGRSYQAYITVDL
jgi:iron complex outermembrane recepter protein